MVKPFIIRLLNAEGKIVANSRVITYNDTSSNSSIITASDFTDNSLTGNIQLSCDKYGNILKTFKSPPFTPVPSPSPTPTPSRTSTPLPTPTPSPSPTPTPSQRPPTYQLRLESDLSRQSGNRTLIATIEETPGNNSLYGNVRARNVPNNTIMYWKLQNPTGTLPAASAIDANVISGSFTIINSYGEFTFSATEDLLKEGSEFFRLSIHTNSLSGPEVASATVSILDTSINESPLLSEFSFSPMPVNETQNKSVTLTFKVIDGISRFYYWKVELLGAASADDFFGETSGALLSRTSLTEDSLYFTIKEDHLLETSAEQFRIDFYLASDFTGSPFASTPVVTIDDSSQAYNPAIYLNSIVTPLPISVAGSISYELEVGESIRMFLRDGPATGNVANVENITLNSVSNVPNAFYFTYLPNQVFTRFVGLTPEFPQYNFSSYDDAEPQTFVYSGTYTYEFVFPLTSSKVIGVNFSYLNGNTRFYKIVVYAWTTKRLSGILTQPGVGSDFLTKFGVWTSGSEPEFDQTYSFNAPIAGTYQFDFESTGVTGIFVNSGTIMPGPGSYLGQPAEGGGTGFWSIWVSLPLGNHSLRIKTVNSSGTASVAVTVRYYGP